MTKKVSPPAKQAPKAAPKPAPKVGKPAPKAAPKVKAAAKPAPKAAPKPAPKVGKPAPKPEAKAAAKAPKPAKAPKAPRVAKRKKNELHLQGDYRKARKWTTPRMKHLLAGVDRQGVLAALGRPQMSGTITAAEFIDYLVTLEKGLPDWGARAKAAEAAATQKGVTKPKAPKIVKAPKVVKPEEAKAILDKMAPKKTPPAIKPPVVRPPAIKPPVVKRA